MSAKHEGQMVPGDRGLFDYVELEDTHRNRIIVRTSSAIGDPCVWIFAKPGPLYPAGHEPSPHLNAEQARLVAAALLRFADEAEGK